MIQINDIFKALSDPTRRTIIELLKERDLSAGEISDYFSISKPSISHHLNILKNADLIISERSGQSIIYSINTTALQDILKWFYDIKN